MPVAGKVLLIDPKEDGQQKADNHIVRIPPAEHQRSTDSSLTKTDISSHVSFKTENKNLSLTRLEFTTRRNGVDINADIPLPKLVKKLVTHLFDIDPTLKIYPINDWPKQYTTGSTTVKTAPETNQNTEKDTEKDTEKTPTTTPKKTQKNRPPSPLPTHFPLTVLVSTSTSSTPPTSAILENLQRSSFVFTPQPVKI
jgi:hypothetical protein